MFFASKNIINHSNKVILKKIAQASLVLTQLGST